MKRDIILPQKEFHTPSFLSQEKDFELICNKLFVQQKPYSDDLLKLLIVNTKDCLDNDTQIYKDAIRNMTVKKLIDQGYIQFTALNKAEEHQEIKSQIFLHTDNYMTNFTNEQYRDCDLFISVVCHKEYWDLGNFRLRPLKIIGYIDGILNKTRLTGIGTLNFQSCGLIDLDQNYQGYTLRYNATHMSDDELEFQGDDI